MWMILANPLVRKLAIYAGIIAAILLFMRWYGNAQWKKGAEDGRKAAAAEISKQKEAEWKAKEEAIAASIASIEAEKSFLANAGERLIKDRANISRALKDGLAAVQAARNNDYENVASVPAVELDSALRAISRDLAAQ